MALLVPGVPTAMFGKLDAQFRVRGRIALVPVAEAVIRQAKINASNGSHKYGTKTPARPGSGPAMISKTLYRSIDRSPVTREVFGYLCQVGMVANVYPQYPGITRPKASSKYAYALEIDGCRNGARYPFLYPAARFAFDVAAPIIYKQRYGSNWVRLI